LPSQITGIDLIVAYKNYVTRHTRIKNMPLGVPRFTYGIIFPCETITQLDTIGTLGKLVRFGAAIGKLQSHCHPTAYPHPTHRRKRHATSHTATFLPGAYLTPFRPPPLTTLPYTHSHCPSDRIRRHLFGIAIEYGVSLDALLIVNGIEADDLLSIGQIIIIPTAEPEETAT
jgi:hypothetical protein